MPLSTTESWKPLSGAGVAAVPARAIREPPRKAAPDVPADAPAVPPDVDDAAGEAVGDAASAVAASTGTSSAAPSTAMAAAAAARCQRGRGTIRPVMVDPPYPATGTS